MAKYPTVGVWLPGYLNGCNSSSPSGQQDWIGNQYYMGLNPGKVIFLGANEAADQSAPGTTCYDGAYQWVLLDSGATAANAVEGCAAYIRLDSGATQGALPETAYEGFTVTTGDQVSGGDPTTYATLFAGVFINPATLNGVANGPTPGNWTMIFVGAGRASVLYGAGQSGVIGQTVYPYAGGANGTFTSNATAPTSGVPCGLAVTAATAGNIGVAYFPNPIYRIPN